jgi:hypothetical protein
MNLKKILNSIRIFWRHLTSASLREFYENCEEMEFGEQRSFDIKNLGPEERDQDFQFHLGRKLNQKFSTPRIRKQFEVRIDRGNKKLILICHEIPPKNEL